MTNTPRDPKQNQNPNDKADKANMDDPNHDRNNDCPLNPSDAADQ